MVLIPSSVTLIRMMLSIIGLWAFLPDKGRTTIYQCKDAAGTTVFTDSPAQLTQCVSFERKTPEPETENPRSSPSQISDEPLPHQKTPQDPAFLDPYAPPPDGIRPAPICTICGCPFSRSSIRRPRHGKNQPPPPSI